MDGSPTIEPSDVSGFVRAMLLRPDAPLPILTADMNGDGCVNGLDVPLLLDALLGGP